MSGGNDAGEQSGDGVQGIMLAARRRMTSHRHHQPRGRYLAEQDAPKLKARAGEHGPILSPQASFAKRGTSGLWVGGFSILSCQFVAH